MDDNGVNVTEQETEATRNALQMQYTLARRCPPLGAKPRKVNFTDYIMVFSEMQEVVRISNLPLTASCPFRPPVLFHLRL